MTITVAGNKKEYEDGLKLTELVERDDFETTKLNEGDAVEFLYFMGGGAY